MKNDGTVIISYSSTVLIAMYYYKLKYIGLYGLRKLFSATSPVLLKKRFTEKWCVIGNGTI